MASQRRRNWQGFALLGGATAFLVAAVWTLTGAIGRADTPAPLPSSVVSADPSQQPVGPRSATVETVDGSQAAVTPETMAPAMLFIPELAVYAPVVPVSGAGRQIDPPFPVSTVGLSTAGADPTGTRGTVLVAGHVTDGPTRGALYPLSTIQGGARAFLTTANGTRTAWQLVSLNAYVKAELPSSIWDTTGDRRLVVVTCGGPVTYTTNRDGTRARVYRDNLVAVFAPTFEH